MLTRTTPLATRTPLRRGGFKSREPQRHVAKQISEDYTPRPRTIAQAIAPTAMARPVPKFAHVRDLRLRTMCRSLCCQHCGASGPDAGVTWAHSNQQRHGKGKSIKACDRFVAALCQRCHMDLDQGSQMDERERLVMWTLAFVCTVRIAIQRGLWPRGIEVPDLEIELRYIQ